MIRILKFQIFVLVLVVLAVVALVADVVVKRRAETELAAQVTKRAAGTTGVRAKISSFPFVGRLAVSGQVPKIVVSAESSATGALPLANIRVEVEDVKLDTGAAVDGRVVVQSIGRGSVQADVDQDEINRRLPLGYRVQLLVGKAVVTGPASIRAELVSTSSGALALRVAGKSLIELPFPTTTLLPCRPTATFVSGAARLTCTFTGVPKLLLDLARS